MRHQKGGKEERRSEENVDEGGKRKREGGHTQADSAASEKVHTHGVPLMSVVCCVKLRKISGRLRSESRSDGLN
jgi:hypothetical protein